MYRNPGLLQNHDRMADSERYAAFWSAGHKLSTRNPTTSFLIPAPVAYTNVAAVKKLVVGFLVDSLGPADQKAAYLSLSAILSWFWSNPGLRYIYFEKIRVFKASLRDEYISME